MKKPLFGVVLGLTIASGAPAALASVPKLVSLGTAPPKVKPAALVYSGDGSAFFAGARKVSKSNFGKLHWKTWGHSKALGTGADWVNNCKPFCYDGTFRAYPVTLKLTAPRVETGRDVFTKMLVTYTGKRPPGVHSKSQTWTLSHNKKFFIWNAPGL